MRANVDVHRASPERKVEKEEKKEELEYMEPMGTQCQYVTMCPSTSTASSAGISQHKKCSTQTLQSQTWVKL